MPKKIKVIVDTRDLRIAKTGAKTYLEEVCRQLQKGNEDFEFCFADTFLPVYRGTNKLLKMIEHVRFFLWKQVSIPLICLIKGADIFFCSDYFLPLVKLRYKTVVVFYDAFFWEYPEQYNKTWLKLVKLIAVPAARKADAIITISEYSKQQIVQHVLLDPEKIHPILLAPKSASGKTVETEAPADPSRKYILHIGVLEKRKNLLNLIKAYQLLLNDGFTAYYLVLVGNKVAKETIDDSKNIEQLIRQSGLQERVILPGFVSDEQLAYYYKNACLYAFVSLNEGFGLPILEAFQHNLPVLISDQGSLPEVGGNAVISCDPKDPSDIKEKIKTILTDVSLQNQLQDKGRKRLADFSWEKTTYALLDVFRKISEH